MNKDVIKNRISNTIIIEYNKHSKSLPEDWYIIASDKIYSYFDEQTKKLQEQIVDINNHNDKLQFNNWKLEKELSDLKSKLTLSEQKVKLNYNTALDLEKQLSENELSDSAIKFAIWYSGMNENSVKKAYQRYVNEVLLNNN